MRQWAHACALLAALTAGCGKTDDLSLAPGDPANPLNPINPPSSTPGNGGGSGSGATGGTGPAGPDEMASQCSALGPAPGPSPLFALSNYELNRSVVALLGSGVEHVAWLDETADPNPFSSSAPTSPERQLHEMAHAVGQELSGNPQAVQAISGCDPLTSGEAACSASFIEALLPRAYRRPATREEQDEMKAVFAEGERLGGDFASGVRAVVEVALQSPDFLYLIETGDREGESTKDALALSGYESAARLAFFVTGSPPDAALSAVAAQGPMSAQTLEEQARRLLGSPESRERVRQFYLALFPLSGEPLSDQGFTPEIARLSREETGRFVEDVTFDGAGTFRALLTEPSTWLNEPLAEFYGVTGISGEELQKVALDPTERGGLLTQLSFLRATSRSLEVSPVQRGMVVLRTLLCQNVPPPPLDVPPVAPDDGKPNATLRERLTAETKDAACQECHEDLNAVGFAFDHYDVVGRWRDTERDQAVDASGELHRTDARGKFQDAIELMARLAESKDAKACFVQHWQTEALRRAPGASDACATAQVVRAFADSDGNLVELMVALSKTDNFRYRLKSELSP
jgi:hypothetical protein